MPLAASHGFSAYFQLVDGAMNGLLLVAALLAVWLLVRVRRIEEERRRPSRRAPMSADELARCVFEVARTADIDEYRGLFLAGAEAAAVFGEGAQTYLARRTMEVLEESLVTIGALIPDGAFYVGVEPTGDGSYAMWVQPREGERFLVGIGTVAQVGSLYRLRDPAFS